MKHGSGFDFGEYDVGKAEWRRVFFLCAVGLLSTVLTLVSFFAWRDGVGDGEIARTASRMEEFFSENEAVAVFFGWDEDDEKNAP